MAVTPSEPPLETSDLHQYMGVLRKRTWSILGVAAVVLGSALFVSFRQTPVYESSAKVLVKPIANPVQLTQPAENLLNLETEREIAGSEEVAERAADEVSRPEPSRDLLDNLSVSIAAGSQVLVFRFSDPDPIRAQEGAEAFADAYIAYKTEQSKTAIDELRRPLQSQIDDLTAQLRALDRRIERSPDGPSASQQSQRDVLTSQIAVLRSQLAPLNSVVVDPGDVIQTAQLPSEPASPDHLLNAGLGLFVGLALGVGIAFLRERLDDRLRGRADLEARSGAPVLGIIPRVQGWKRDRTLLITVEEPKSAASEAYRTLRTSVLFVAAQNNVRKIMVASADAGEGKTTTAANLAVVLAQVERRVVLVSADVRKPRLHRFFGVDNAIGLVNVLTGEERAAKALVPTRVPNLRLLPSGPVPTLPAELLGSEAMGELMEWLQRQADFVLIDTPALLAVSDALSLAPLTDGVIYVADDETTTRTAVAHARAQLAQMGANVFASVLNGFDPAKARTYPYYRYSYHYPSPPERVAPPELRAPAPEEGWPRQAPRSI